jgi:hypothetical protein
VAADSSIEQNLCNGTERPLPARPCASPDDCGTSFAMGPEVPALARSLAVPEIGLAFVLLDGVAKSTILSANAVYRSIEPCLQVARNAAISAT